jgi:hypothetical protein
MMIYDLSKVPADIREQIENTPKYRELFSKFPKELLAIDSNAKTIKGQKKGFKTAILYLTPASGSGENMCALAALAQCDEPCLNTAGRGAMSNVQISRLRKTLFFIQYRDQFLALLRKEIRRVVKTIEKSGFTQKAKPVKTPVVLFSVNIGNKNWPKKLIRSFSG